MAFQFISDEFSLPSVVSFQLAELTTPALTAMDVPIAVRCKVGVELTTCPSLYYTYAE